MVSTPICPLLNKFCHHIEVLQRDRVWLLKAGPVLGHLYKVLTQVWGDVLGQRSITEGCAVGGHTGSVIKVQNLLPAKIKPKVFS